jgi:hypothetical protein
MVQSLRGQEDRPVKGQDRATYPPSRVEGQPPEKLTLFIKVKRPWAWGSGQEVEEEQIS